MLEDGSEHAPHDGAKSPHQAAPAGSAESSRSAPSPRDANQESKYLPQRWTSRYRPFATL